MSVIYCESHDVGVVFRNLLDKGLVSSAANHALFGTCMEEKWRRTKYLFQTYRKMTTEKI